MNKVNLRFEKNTVLNLCHCICGGDWFHAGILESRKLWLCDNCGKLYDRNIEVQRIVIEENLVEINLEG